MRVSAMMEDLSEIAEMDLNPVKVLPPGQGCVVVDARILVQASEFIMELEGQVDRTSA